MAVALRRITLADHAGWDPVQLLAPHPFEVWMTSDLVQLLEVGTVLRATYWPDEEDTVVRASDIDRVTGSVTVGDSPHRGAAYSVGAAGLREGDLLIPPNGDPALLIGHQHRGFLFSGSFSGYRPERVDPLWVWSALNSTRGRDARQMLTRGGPSVQRRPPELASLTIPREPPREVWGQKRGDVAALEAEVAAIDRRTDLGQSWWRVCGLPGDGDWNLLIAMPDPESVAEGRPLSDFITEVRHGRRPEVLFEEPYPDLLPLVTGKQLVSRAPFESFGVPAEPIAEVGDLLVQRIGEKGRAVVVQERCLVGPNLLLARFSAGAQPDEVCSYLNSPEGQRQRKMRAGGGIPRLDRKALLQIRMPSSWTRPQTDSRPLSAKLDDVLWRS